MLELSSIELSALPTETPVYDGVGKMCVVMLVIKILLTLEGLSSQALTT